MTTMTRRHLLQGTAAGLALGAASRRASPLAPATLAPPAFRPLPLGEVRPAGWLQRQLRIQADGLGGHLDEFWPDVGPNSGWLGGTGESWERGPYFLDGLVPLAYLLDDDVLKAKAQRFLDWTLDHQEPSGMIGPPANNDWWPRMVMVKALAQYFEATRDPRVLPALTRYFHYQLAQIPGRPLQSWGKYRWQDEVFAIQWLYERTQDDKLLQLAALLRAQGYDWEALFADFHYTDPTPRSVVAHGQSPEGMQTHGVNHSQALKTAAVQYRLSANPAERTAFFHQLATLDKYHGEPNGMFSCDEHLAGLEPQHGIELCSVVETMFSLEVALSTFGDPSIADRLEKIAFNALPGTFTDDMWAHQYDQQSNQVQVGLLTKPWTTNGPEANLFGLQPNFGCCTANFHQGWPKLTASLWMKTAAADGLAATIYAPCELRSRVHNTPLHIVETTDYPFRDTVRLTVNPEKSMVFTLHLRIPEWARDATLRINNQPATIDLKPGSFAPIKRAWAPGDTVALTLPMQPRVSRWFNRSVALERGPLVFSYSPGESWVKLRDRGMTADWQVFPTQPWNYALGVDETTLPEVKLSANPVAAQPFSAAGNILQMHVPARRLDPWRSQDGVSPAPPPSPASSAAQSETITLIPYASAKLRVTAFPSLLS